MINMVYLVGFVLVMLRISAFFVSSQILLPKPTPNIVKVIFIVSLSYVITPLVSLDGIEGFIENNMIFIIVCINEVLTGLIFGFVTYMCFEAIKFAGALIDFQAGLSMMSMYDPTTGSNAALVEKLYSYLALTIVFVFDGHHIILKAIINTFNTIPLGKNVISQDSISSFLKIFINFFEIGFRIALPIILVLLLTDIVLGIVSRTVPQLNVMILGTPVKLLITLVLIIGMFPVTLKLIKYAFEQLPGAFRSLYKAFPIIFIFSSAGEKTEEATGKKLQDARKKGQVAKSRDIALTFTLLAATLMFLVFGDFLIEQLKIIMANGFKSTAIKELSEAALFSIILSYIGRGLLIVILFAAVVMIVGVAANIAQTGFIKTSESLKPDFKKMNPINGFKNIFSMRSVVSLFKNILLITVIGFIAVKFYTSTLDDVMRISLLSIDKIPSKMISVGVKLFSLIGIAMMIISLGDFVYQKWKYKKDMRMTKQEVKEEYKQMEGNPEVKAKRREKMRELSRRRMMAEVPNATVVITNPTHISVALKYEEGGESAPKVVAKGADNLALKIKEIAMDNKVPVVENKPLARMIYSQVELESEIPVEMYAAVAEILAVVINEK